MPKLLKIFCSQLEQACALLVHVNNTGKFCDNASNKLNAQQSTVAIKF